MKKLSLFLVLILALVVGLNAPFFFPGNPYDNPPEADLEKMPNAPVYGAGIIGMGEVVSGMRAAALEKPGTFIMQKDSNIMFAWYKSGAWRFVNVLTNGNFAPQTLPFRCSDCSTLSNMIKNMTTYEGWKVITAAEVPAAIKATLIGQSFLSAVATVATRGLTTFWLIPLNANSPLTIQEKRID